MGSALYSSSMAEYGDRELSYSMSGDDIQELQVKLSGWYSTYPADKPRWDGNFDNSTYEAVRSFQASHNLPPDGVVDHWTFVRIDEEASNHFFSLNSYLCPTRKGGCVGFGSGKSSFTHLTDVGKTSILIPGGEKPGVSKVLVWLLRGLLHRADCSYFNVPGGGYRCAYNNEAKNRTTVNHVGYAIDILPYRADWSAAKQFTPTLVGGYTVNVGYTDAAQNFRDVCVAAGVSTALGHAAGDVYMEPDVPATPSGAYTTSWVHLDVRTALDSVGGHPTEWFATTHEEINAPLYMGQLISFASAAPPNGPPTPDLPSTQIDEAEAVAAASGLDSWVRYVSAEQTFYTSSSSGLAGTSNHQLAAAQGLPSDLINEGHSTGVNGARREAYDRADAIESSRRSFLLAQHTRDDYRNFGRITNLKLVEALRSSNAAFRRRFENYTLPAESCSDA